MVAMLIFLSRLKFGFPAYWQFPAAPMAPPSSLQLPSNQHEADHTCRDNFNLYNEAAFTLSGQRSGIHGEGHTLGASA